MDKALLRIPRLEYNRPESEAHVLGLAYGKQEPPDEKGSLMRPLRECSRFRVALIAAAFFLRAFGLAALGVRADEMKMGPAIGAEKKLLKWGVDAPSCEEYRDRIEELERLPFDGWVVHATVRINGGTAIIQGQMSSTHRFTYDDLKHNVESMKAAGSAKLTDNFLELRTAADDLVAVDAENKETGRIQVEHPDWFSDADFEIMTSNWALMARIARESGMKGFMLDFEQWGHKNGKYPRPWDYRFLVEHNEGRIPSFEEHERMYRRRGRELADAVCRAFPDIVLFSYMTLHNGAYGRINAASETDPDLSALANTDHALYPAFLDGLLEGIAADSETVLIDGGSLYAANLNGRFLGYRNHGYAENYRYSRASKSAKSRMRLAFAVWVDGRGWRTKSDWSWPWLQEPPYWANQFTPDELEHAFYYALLNADTYAWVWNEQARFVSDCGWTMKGPANVPDDYMRALADCKKPHRMDFARTDRGGLTDPPAPKVPPYDEEKVFGALKAKYEHVGDLPLTWRFLADGENVGSFGAEYGKVDWNYCGETWRDWGTIEIGDYWENRGVKFNGHGWYRTAFDVPAELAGKKIFLCFGGITLHPVVGAQVYVNGTLFWAASDVEKESAVLVLDITEAAKPGEENVVVVKIFNYGGPGGIFRPVKLATLREAR